MRVMALLAVWRNPSCVCENEIAFPILSSEALILFNFESILELTASPAASSEGLTILEPDERRNSELDNALLLTARLLAVFSATLFELITTMLGVVD